MTHEKLMMLVGGVDLRPFGHEHLSAHVLDVTKIQWGSAHVLDVTKIQRGRRVTHSEGVVEIELERRCLYCSPHEGVVVIQQGISWPSLVAHHVDKGQEGHVLEGIRPGAVIAAAVNLEGKFGSN